MGCPGGGRAAVFLVAPPGLVEGACPELAEGVDDWARRNAGAARPAAAHPAVRRRKVRRFIPPV
jgi:hypothetical protein